MVDRSCPATAHRLRAQSRLLGARTFRPSAASTISTASPSNISSTPTPSSRRSRKASARSTTKQIRSSGSATSTFRPAATGEVVTEAFETGIPPVVTGFLFNTRLPKFADVRVRRALAMLYDFEWANKNLFDGQFKRTASYWQNSELSALGRPASETGKGAARALPRAGAAEVMDGTLDRPPQTDGSGHDRDALEGRARSAEERRLPPRGRPSWSIRRASPFGFEILTASQSEERLAAALPAHAGQDRHRGDHPRARGRPDPDAQAALRLRRADRLDRLHRHAVARHRADRSAGVRRRQRPKARSTSPASPSPAIDAVIEAMLNARDKDDYVAAVRALDRLLISGRLHGADAVHNRSSISPTGTYLEHPPRDAALSAISCRPGGDKQDSELACRSEKEPG